jgi:hypothetical protein
VTRLPWQAPRTAYLLTAAVAAGDEAAADALWNGLDDDATEADVLTALGAQARLAAQQRGTRAAGGFSGGKTRFGMEACDRALDAMTALLADPPLPWELPQCSHCRKLLATAIAAFSLEMARQRGLSAEVFAGLCRDTASRAART